MGEDNAFDPPKERSVSPPQRERCVTRQPYMYAVDYQLPCRQAHTSNAFLLVLTKGSRVELSAIAVRVCAYASTYILALVYVYVYRNSGVEPFCSGQTQVS